MKESKCEWKLVWSEEFQNQTLDTEKWEIENELFTCHGNYIEQLNCNTNSTKNLNLINGTLAITAIYEKLYDKDYTSAKIATKQGFTYGRFEIRAALPKGKLLRPAIFMNPNPYAYSPNWARNGQIDIMTNSQTPKLGSGLHYDKPSQYDSYGDYTTNKVLNDFHIYALEWDEFTVKWFLDDINYQTINISRSLGSLYTKNGQPFDKPFKLFINLGVGGVNSKETLTIEDVMNWKCSLLIIDYVRVYNWVNHTENENLMLNSVSPEEICASVMPLIRLKKQINNKAMLTRVISVMSTLLMLALITIVGFLWIKHKKLKDIKIENELNDYEENNIYDTVIYDVLNTSSEDKPRYLEIGNNYFECNKTVLKENVNSNPFYLQITNLKENVKSKPIYLDITNET